eukprot:3232516-Prymnesium_polylepis.2
MSLDVENVLVLFPHRVRRGFPKSKVPESAALFGCLALHRTAAAHGPHVRTHEHERVPSTQHQQPAQHAPKMRCAQ